MPHGGGVQHLDPVVVGVRVAFDQSEFLQCADLSADRRFVQHVVRGQICRAAAVLVLDVRQQRVRDQGELGVETGRRGPRAACEGGEFPLDDVQRLFALLGGAWHCSAFRLAVLDFQLYSTTS